MAFTKIFKALSISMLISMVASKQSITMKTLVLSTKNMDNEFITLNLNSYGIPFDIIQLKNKNSITGNLTMYDSDNQPKYNLIVVNGGRLSYESS